MNDGCNRQPDKRNTHGWMRSKIGSYDSASQCKYRDKSTKKMAALCVSSQSIHDRLIVCYPVSLLLLNHLHDSVSTIWNYGVEIS